MKPRPPSRRSVPLRARPLPAEVPEVARPAAPPATTPAPAAVAAPTDTALSEEAIRKMLEAAYT